MIKGLLFTALGAAGALQVDRWLSARKARFSPKAMTGALLDRANERLEAKRFRAEGSSRSGAPGL